MNGLIHGASGDRFSQKAAGQEYEAIGIFSDLPGTIPQIYEAFRNKDVKLGLEMLEPYIPAVQRFILLRTDKSRVEDITQEVLLKLVKFINSDNFDQTKFRFRAILCTCTVRAIADDRRKVKRNAKEVSLDESIHDSSGHDALADSQDIEEFDKEYLQSILNRGMGVLKERVGPVAWAVFKARADGKPVADIANEHGVTPENVRETTSRLKTMLREICEKLSPDGYQP